MDGRNPAPPKNPGLMIPLYIPANNGFLWFHSGANGFCQSTVSPKAMVETIVCWYLQGNHLSRGP